MLLVEVILNIVKLITESYERESGEVFHDMKKGVIYDKVLNYIFVKFYESFIYVTEVDNDPAFDREKFLKGVGNEIEESMKRGDSSADYMAIIARYLSDERMELFQRKLEEELWIYLDELLDNAKELNDAKLNQEIYDFLDKQVKLIHDDVEMLDALIKVNDDLLKEDGEKND